MGLLWVPPWAAVRAWAWVPRSARTPGHRTVVLALLAMVLLWTLLTSGLHDSPPWDNAEQLVWSSSLEWGYYKHPPLPTWLMACLVALFGREVWLTYGAAMGCVALALWFMWRLALEFMPPRRAAMATALVSVIGYHSLSGVVFNHNTVQLAPIAAFWFYAYRALKPGAADSSDSSTNRAWLLAGLCAGLALLTKYSALVQVAVVLAYIVATGRWRQRSVQLGLLQASLVALVLVLPHVLWVLDNPQQSLGYARHSLHSAPGYGAALVAFWHVLHVQVGRLLPMLLVLGLAHALHRGWPSRLRPAAAAMDDLRVDAALKTYQRQFLRCCAYGPLAVAAVIAVVLRVPMATAWPTTFFLPWGLLAVAALPLAVTAAQRQAQWRLVMTCVLALHLLLAVGQGAGRGALALYAGSACRSNLPAGEIAQALQALWASRVQGSPLAYVAGETWFAGSVAVKTGPATQVVVDGDLDKSPWISEPRLRRCGALVLLHDTPGYASESPTLEALYARSTVRGQWQRPWTHRAGGPQIVVRWGIVPPGGRCDEVGDAIEAAWEPVDDMGP